MEIETRHAAFTANPTHAAVPEHWNPVEFLAQWMRHRSSQNPHAVHAHDDEGSRLQSSTNSANDPIIHRASEELASEQHHQHCDNSYVTLYFDGEKNLTIAVLSRPTEALGVYFKCRVEQGSAHQRSILYYELDGFVRQNLTSLRRQQYLSEECIRTAVGSLEASDRAHRRFLEEDRIRESQVRHRRSNEFEMFEEVMEIAREHWLDDDLDTLSIYFLGQVNKASRRIAQRIVKHRLQGLSVTVTPYLDGTYMSGYSNFNRSTSTSVVRHLESGRSVEYCMCSPVILEHANRQDDELGTYVTMDSRSGTITWKCEELALGNLHRWWGDIECLEYMGQKFSLACALPQADIVDGPTNVTLASVRLEANPRPGRRRWLSSTFVNLEVDILESHMKKLDDVAILYEGKANITSVSVGFMALVQAVARRRLSNLRLELDSIKQSRPLLDHELTYFRLVQEAASM